MAAYGRFLPVDDLSSGSTAACYGHPVRWSNPMQRIGQVECNGWVSAMQTGGQVERNSPSCAID